MGKTIKMNSRPRGRPPKWNKAMSSYPSGEASSVQKIRSRSRHSKIRKYRKKYFPNLWESEFVKVSKKTLRLLNLKLSSKLKEEGCSLYSVPIKFLCPKEVQIRTTPLDEKLVALLKNPEPAGMITQSDVNEVITLHPYILNVISPNPFAFAPPMTLEPFGQISAAALSTCTFDLQSIRDGNSSSKGGSLAESSLNQSIISDEFNSFVNYILDDEVDCADNPLMSDCFANLHEFETTTDLDDTGSSSEIEILEVIPPTFARVSNYACYNRPELMRLRKKTTTATLSTPMMILVPVLMLLIIVIFIVKMFFVLARKSKLLQARKNAW